MKLSLKIIGPGPASFQPDGMGLRQSEDETLVSIEAEGDLYQVAAQLHAVANSMLPPQRWVTGEVHPGSGLDCKLDGPATL